MKKIVAKEEYCMGCKLCEVYCSTKNSKSKDIIKTFKSKGGKILSSIVVEEKQHITFAIQCRHCEDAPCVYSCLTSAMYKTDKGVVLHDKNKCVGCWMCVMVCPFGIIKPDLDTKKVASKCDLCIDKEILVCVENCPNEALILIEQEKKGPK
ncbi:MAG: 4Fe-4S dicluster domain-containing protein [Endomicrobia bacterium]|nr:4Fe-4S dicluster domain-containing protein [Endomicrobiia bacterium]